jgi:pimeloyl-ACP methyl ester carboxylesterase
MEVSNSIFDRVSSSVKSSIFSPFNGWAYYFNNKATRSASDFLGWVATNNVMENKIQRITVPTLLVYGKSDLIAPFEVGKHILNTISTPNSHKKLVVLENSRHGAEHSDVKVLQDEISSFIEQYR